MSSVNQLDPYFQSLISNIMMVEREPIARLSQKQAELNVQRGVYLDVRSTLKDLQNAASALSVSLTPGALTPGRKASVTNAPTGLTVLSAAAGSGAVTGTYDVAVTQLAQAQRRVSAEQASTDLALGKSGTFWLGGSGTAGAALTGNSTVSSAGTGTVASGQSELGAGAYTVETREVNGAKQFRLKNADGNIVTIADASGRYTNEWQTLAAGTHDTKRGLTLNFSGATTDASTAVTYTAAGVGVAVAATDTLQDIVSRINAATQPEGREAAASIVGKQLVLSATRTGTAHTMIYSEADWQGGSLGFTGVDLQVAKNAVFTVNNISFTRSFNANLTDVIGGVSLSLAADAEGKSATLNVNVDQSSTRTALDNFIASFNRAQAYLQQKTSVVVNRTEEAVTATRGPLAGDSSFRELRSQLLMVFGSDQSNSGIYQNLRDIGLKINDNLQASVSDSAKLDAALGSHLTDVQSLLEKVMTTFNSQLSRFTASGTGYVDATVQSLDSQISEASAQVAAGTKRLNERQDFYIRQYGEMQAQLMLMAAQKSQLASG